MSVATFKLGLAGADWLRAGPRAKRRWVIDTAYVANDVVTRTGNTYVNILASTGNDPATDAGVHWVVIRTGITCRHCWR